MPLVNSNNESWTQGLTGLADRSAEYYKQVCEALGMLLHGHARVVACHTVQSDLHMPVLSLLRLYKAATT